VALGRRIMQSAGANPSEMKRHGSVGHMGTTPLHVWHIFLFRVGKCSERRLLWCSMRMKIKHQHWPGLSNNFPRQPPPPPPAPYIRCTVCMYDGRCKVTTRVSNPPKILEFAKTLLRRDTAALEPNVFNRLLNF